MSKKYDDDWIECNACRFNDWISLTNSYNLTHETEHTRNNIYDRARKIGVTKLGKNCKQYTDEEAAWLTEFYPLSHNDTELAEWFFYKFGKHRDSRGLAKICRTNLNLKRDNGRHEYTVKEDEWLVDNFARLGREECTKQFNELFQASLSSVSIGTHCNRDLGVKCSKKTSHRFRKSEDDKYKTHEIGYISHQKGSYYIKTKDGWKRLSHTLVDVPDGHIVIHLDKDHSNNSLDNLMVVENGVQRTVMNYDMWEPGSEFVKTAFLWGQLYKKVKKI